MKKNVLVFYGGKSCEHDISIITALQVMDNCDKEKYNVVPVYMDRGGIFRTSDRAAEIEIYKNISDKKIWRQVTLLPHDDGLYAVKGVKRLARLFTAHAALVCNHGMGGEDGTLQGLLELCNIPYTSASVAGSAVGMDKIFMKRIFAALELPILPYVTATREEFLTDKEKLLARIEGSLEFPLIVKPSNLGSSIGINKSTCRQELCYALSTALQFDSRAIIEKAVENLREVNIAALKKDRQILVSQCEEPVLWQSFLSFEDKYLAGESKGMTTQLRKMPAEISAPQQSDIERWTKILYQELQCNAPSRVDFIIDKDDERIYVNEINTVPGSFSFYLFEKSLSLREIVDISIQNALDAHKSKNMNKFAYESPVLTHYQKGGKTGK